MTPQVFLGTNTRDALAKVRQTLGDEAVILSNKTVNGQTEIIAASPQAIEQLAKSGNAMPRANQTSTGGDGDSIAKEVKELRSILEGQLANMAWQTQKHDKGRVAVAKTMLNAGFSALLARTLSSYTKPGCTPEQAIEWLKSGLAKHLLIPPKDMIDEGGVFALLGPTGVGKTTTTAKIAARCAQKHGPKSFALITTDTYRLAAEEQLRGFGKIFGSPVHVVNNVDDMQATLSDLRNKKVILIDTVGMSQRDQRVSDQIAMLSRHGIVKRVLVLNCATGGAVLDDIVNVYTDKRHGSFHGTILTKTDEAIQLGSALDVLIRKKLPLFYVTTGQRVPEDIQMPNARSLIEQAFASAHKNPFSVSEFEMNMGGAE